MAIKVDFLANVVNFLRGTRDVEGSLEDVSGSLDGLAADAAGAGSKIGDSISRGGKRAEAGLDGAADAGRDLGRQTEQGARSAERALDQATTEARQLGDRLQDSARDAERALKRTGDEADDLGKQVRDGGQQGERAVDQLTESFEELRRKANATSTSAGDDLGKNVGAGAREAKAEVGEATREIADEAKSNLSEVASSFRGDMASLGDLAQGTLGGLVGGLGPAGIAIGAAGAAAIGLVIGATEQATERTEEQRARVAELTAAYIEAGNRGELSMEQVSDKLAELATSTEDGVLSLSKLNEITDQSESGFRSIAQAYAGYGDELDELIRKEDAHRISLEDEASAIDTTASASYGAAIRRADDQAKVVAALRDASAEAKLAAEQQRLYLASGADDLRRTAEAADDYASRVGDALGDTGLAYEQQNAVLDAQIESAREVVRANDQMLQAHERDGAAVDENLQARARWAAGVITQWQEVQRSNESAAQNEAAYAASGIAELEAKQQRITEYADSIEEELEGAGADWQKYQDEESGALNLEAYNAAIEARVAAMANYRTNMQGLQGNINADALAYLQSLGAEAAPLLQAYVDAPLDQQERTAANWATLGSTAASSYTGDLESGIPATVQGPEVIINRPDMSLVESAIAQFGTRRINVVANVITKIGQQVYD